MIKTATAILIIVFLITLQLKASSNKLKQDGGANIESFGAVANNPDIDNSAFIIKALESSAEILIPANKTYYIKHSIVVQSLANKTINATNATIINVNYEEASFIFTQCTNIKINGGYYTRDVLPQVQDGKKQCTFSFVNCNTINVIRTHINRSPEMGINLNVVINANILDNTIEHCLRDGVYAHYSANLKYIGNHVNEIKDDALSMHDYGIDAQRTALKAAGYEQAGHSEIRDNTITNAIQGISSIGCTDIVISHNNIKNTVHAGIVIFNDERLYPGTTARANNITIANNVLDKCGVDVMINGLLQRNNGQIGTGRAAIFVGSFGSNPHFGTSTLRLADITIQDNTVTNSAVNGATLHNIDGLTVNGNSFLDCHSETHNAPQFTGDIVEFYNCTNINVRDNSVVDDREETLHNRSFLFQNCTGIFQKGNEHGWKIEDVKMVNSRLQ